MFGGNMAKMMQQAQQMKTNIETAKQEVAAIEVTTSSGNELTLTLNGKHEITNLKLSEAVLDDKELLEDMLILTFNNAVTEVNQQSEAIMKKATGGINLPF